MFFRGSRYDAVADAELPGRDGRVLRYKRRRIAAPVPAPLATIVRAGDRPDLLAWRALGDPELFWMLCDANLVERPAELTATPGATVAVPGPETGQP